MGTASTVAVQILPPAPRDSSLAFDKFQFQKRIRAVSSESRISFSDFESMHIATHSTFRHKRYIPAFATDPAKLRKVVALAAWRYVHCGARMSDGLENNLPKLIRITDKKFARDDAKVIRKRARKLQRVIRARYKAVNNLQGRGGWLKVKAAIAFRSWRLGETSPQVAAQLCMTPYSVRVVLYRLCEIAEQLGYKTFKRRRQKRKLRRPS